MTLNDIRDILSKRDLALSKSLGQNFLHDQNQVRRIVAAAEAGPEDKILEIGPGLGPLTEGLLRSGAQVPAIEKDRRLFDFLQQKFAGLGRLQLFHDDALAYLKTHRAWGGWKLVSNLPYSAGSAMLVELAQAETPPERMVATLQIEVAQRLAAEAGSKHYGILSLTVQLALPLRGLVQNPPVLLFPGAGRGQRLRHPPAPAGSPAGTGTAPRFRHAGQTGFLAKAENDVQTPQTELARGPADGGLPRTGSLPAKSAPKPSPSNNSSAWSKSWAAPKHLR